MAQIIKHRRGSLEALSAATSSFQKGEIIIVTGSANITASNGSSLLFAAVESGSIQATNRFIVGDAAPNVFPNSVYNGLLKGVPYYASASATLYLLGTDSNSAINLVGNIQPFSSSVSASLAQLSSSIGTGNIGNSVTLLNTFSGSVLTQLSTLGTETASIETRLGTIGSYTSSLETRMGAVATVTGSLISSASAAAVADAAEAEV